MRERNRTARRLPPHGAAALAAVAVVLAGVPAAAEEVGRFSIVTNDVTSLRPGAAQPVPARVGARIVLDERERTGERSAAQMTFGEGAIVSIGAETDFAVTRAVVDEATGASASVIDVLVGKIRVFVSRFWTERPEVAVTTPTTVVGIKGSEAVIEVFEDGTTRVTFLSGSGRVRSKAPPGPWREMSAGEQVLIRPRAAGPPAPTRAGPGAERDLVAATRPVPDQPRDRPRARDDGDYGPPDQPPAGVASLSGVAGVVMTSAPASGGNLLVPPVSTRPPPDPLPLFFPPPSRGQEQD